MRIDHVLYGVRDLGAARRWFAQELGLASTLGGVHPQLGTENAIVSVGPGQYIELIAVADASINHALPKFLSAMTADGDRPVAICLRPVDLDDVARRLGVTAVHMHRQTPDGDLIEWRLAGMEGALGPERLPFFIDWGPRASELDAHNAAVAPDGAITWVEIGGEPERLVEWIGEPVDGLRQVDGPPGVTRLAIRCGATEIVIGPRNGS